MDFLIRYPKVYSLKKSHYALRGLGRPCKAESSHMGRTRSKVASVRECPSPSTLHSGSTRDPNNIYTLTSKQ